jgi:rhamnosyl/mannosyltransferase
MRVLFVYKDYAPVVGGIENHLRLLAEGLRARGIETHVLVTNTGARTKQELLGGVPVIKAGRLLTVSSAPVSIRLRHTGRRLVLFVGCLRHYKGLDVLLAAMQQVAAHLLVVGSGRMEATWHRQAERDGVMGRVTFLGQVSDEELVALYHAADILILPSTNRAESWGTVLVEAMACGLPVVSTELGTGTSIVNQDGVTGLVVPPCDANALAAALRGLLDDEARRKELAAAAHARAVGEFSKEVMLDRVIEFYREAAAHQHDRPQESAS